MKKILLTTALLLALLLTLTACSASRPYTWAIIVIDGRTIAEGHLDSWSHKIRCNAIIVEIDGIFYYTARENVVLMETPPTTTDQPKTTTEA